MAKKQTGSVTLREVLGYLFACTDGDVQPSLSRAATRGLAWGLVVSAALILLALVFLLRLIEPVSELTAELNAVTDKIRGALARYGWGALGVGIAAALFALRMRLRHIYGLIEFGFGVVGCFLARGSHFSMNEVKWLAYLASVFVIVRGLDNLFTATRDARARP